MEIEASLIIEMMGRPKEYLKNTMNQLIAVMESEQGLKLGNKKVYEPKKVDLKEKVPEDREMFSIYAEIDIKCDMEKLFFIISKYMPSHVEIIKPEGIKMTNLEISALMTEFARRLHRYDEIAKAALIKNQILENQLKRMQPVQMPVANPQQPEVKVEKEKKKAKKKKR